ncbi:MAG: hypothetical protein GVY13_16815 [Alphaproteobacteria bacterium]|jgi:hypothetical protein|nr:hypothetical protein [Alphaproteobacteria bacterium]
MTTSNPAAVLPGSNDQVSFASTTDVAATEEGEAQGTALEIQNELTGTIYRDGGDEPIPRDVWDMLETDLPGPFIKNSTRNLLFQETEFLESPSATEDGELIFIDYLGYTWLELAQAVAAGLYQGNGIGMPFESGFPVIGPGEATVSIIDKPQTLTFSDPTAYILTDEWGNRYVMHATAAESPEVLATLVADVELPAGWTVAETVLAEPLTITPSDSEAGAFYVIIRDNTDNAYHQFDFSGTAQPTQPVGASIVVGGNDGDSLDGTADANSLYGAGGDDSLQALEGDDTVLGDGGDDTLTGGAGDDRLEGGDGTDTAAFTGVQADYTVTEVGADVRIASLTASDGSDLLNGIESYRFADGTFTLSMLLAPETVDLGVYRFFNVDTARHFYTSSPTERDAAINTVDAFVFEGTGFRAVDPAEPDATPVFGFVNSETGGVFYTVSEAERDFVSQTLPQYGESDIAWYAFETETEETVPLHRFFNSATGSHFYTADDAEKDAVLGTLPQFAYEGVGFHVAIA